MLLIYYFRFVFGLYCVSKSIFCLIYGDLLKENEITYFSNEQSYFIVCDTMIHMYYEKKRHSYLLHHLFWYLITVWIRVFNTNLYKRLFLKFSTLEISSVVVNMYKILNSKVYERLFRYSCIFIITIYRIPLLLQTRIETFEAVEKDVILCEYYYVKISSFILGMLFIFNDTIWLKKLLNKDSSNKVH